MGLLDNQAALITGASRGIGRGVAIELARHGAAVVIAARTKTRSDTVRIDGDGPEVGGSLEEVAETINSEGGKVLAVPCDLSEADQIEALVAKTREAFGRIDILVNNGMPQQSMIGRFWELPISVFDGQMTIGPRSYYLAARSCAPIMIEQGNGLIVNISSPGSCVDFYGAPYCISRAASDRMAQALASDLAGTGVRAYSLWPSYIRTERVVMASEGQAAGFDVPAGFDPAKEANSPDMVGRAIAHLAADRQESDRNGTVVTLAELASKYGFTDVDGRPAMRLEFVDYALKEFGRVLPLAFAKISQ
jgi:NAD(P)-dependent dehydrogenase (short-subunit alcohol dehydrogenase family)